MSLNFGNQGGGVHKTEKATTKNAGVTLLGAFNPQILGSSGMDTATAEALKKAGVNIGSNLQGIPGVQTFDMFGNPLAPGSNTLPSLLPKFADIGTYNTLFEKADSGGLTPTAQGMLDAFNQAAQNPIDYASLFGKLGIGGGMGGGAGGGVKATPPPNIGVLTSNIVKDLPPEFQTFITNTLDASSPERVAETIQEFEDAISARAQQNASIIGEDLLDAFAGEGQATSGAAKAELKSLALQAATEANAQIAAGRIQILEQQIQAMQVGTQLVNTLTSAGAAEQANLVSLQTAEIQANASIQIAQLNNQAQIQQTLIAATAQLEGQRMNMLTAGFEGLLGESSREEQARIGGLAMPYDVLLGLYGKDVRAVPDSSGIDLSSLIKGGASIASAFI